MPFPNVSEFKHPIDVGKYFKAFFSQKCEEKQQAKTIAA